MDQCAQHTVQRKLQWLLSPQPARQIVPCQDAGGCRFDIALHAGDLTGKVKPWTFFERKVALQQARRIKEGVAVHYTVADKFCLLQSRDHRKDPLLLGEL